MHKKSCQLEIRGGIVMVNSLKKHVKLLLMSIVGLIQDKSLQNNLL